MPKTSKKQEPIQEITRDMNIGEIMTRFPEAAEIMMSYGLHCIGCAISMYETLEMGCKTHGMSDEDIDNLVEDINECRKELMEKQDKKK